MGRVGEFIKKNWLITIKIIVSIPTIVFLIMAFNPINIEIDLTERDEILYYIPIRITGIYVQFDQNINANFTIYNGDEDEDSITFFVEKDKLYQRNIEGFYVNKLERCKFHVDSEHDDIYFAGKVYARTIKLFSEITYQALMSLISFCFICITTLEVIIFIGKKTVGGIKSVSIRIRIPKKAQTGEETTDPLMI